MRSMAKLLRVAFINLALFVGPPAHGQLFESDSKRLGDGKMDIVVREIDRRPRASVLQIDIKKIAIENGTLRVVQEQPGGGRNLTSLANVTFALTDLKNSQIGKLSFAADVSIDQSRPAPGTNGSAQGRMEGNFNVSLANEAS